MEWEQDIFCCRPIQCRLLHLSPNSHIEKFPLRGNHTNGNNNRNNSNWRREAKHNNGILPLSSSRSKSCRSLAIRVGSLKANDLSSLRRHSVERSGDGGGNERRGEQRVELLSWEPRAFVYHNFLSQEECEHLIKLRKPYMQKSSVVDSSKGRRKIAGSSRTFRTRGQDNADFTFISVEHGEGLQILHYEVGQKYEPHFDYFKDEYNTRNGGQRIATALMYLSDVEEGGETVFPQAKWNISSVPWWNGLSECSKGGLPLKPTMGNTLLFWSMKPDATLDELSLHGGCPVIKGNKWSSTK